VRIIIGLIVVVICGALAGWYFYLHSQEQTTQATSAAQGLGASTPTFGVPTTGSTQANQALATRSLQSNNATSAASSTSALWEIDQAPVAGMGFVDTDTNEYVYYIERANGYVFSAHPSARTIVRLTDTLTPKIYEAQFAQDGSFIERSLASDGSITTFLGRVASSTESTASSTGPITATADAGGPQRVVGGNLVPNIRSLALDRVSRAIFYLVPNAIGGVDGISMQWDGSKKKTLFSSPIGSWNPLLLDDGTIVLVESPADGVLGYAFSVGSTGSLTPLLTGIPGLTVLPKAASSLVLYGSSTGTGLTLTGRATTTPISLSLQTIADKCVWLPGGSEVAYCAVPNSSVSGNYLDDWYKGLTHTSDDWWQVDLSTGATKLIYSPSADNVSIDVEDPIIDPSGNYITFKNATDQSLWSLHVAQ